MWPQPSEQEVKNLKVCIELTGLRLSKPRHLHNLQELWDRQGQLNHDRPPFGAPIMGLSPTSKASLPQLQTARREKLDPCPSEFPRVIHGVPAVDRKVKANGFEEKGVKRKAEVEKGWTKEPLEYTESDTGTSSHSVSFKCTVVSEKQSICSEQRNLSVKIFRGHLCQEELRLKMVRGNGVNWFCRLLSCFICMTKQFPLLGTKHSGKQCRHRECCFLCTTNFILPPTYCILHNTYYNLYP